jgi:hypothetical protein
VSIERNGSRLGLTEVWLGHSGCHHLWKARGRVRPPHYAIDARVMVLMAGAITEQHLLFEERGGDGSDMAQVDRLIPHDPGDRRKSRLAAATWMLVARHADRIVLLASALREHRTLAPGGRRSIGRVLRGVGVSAATALATAHINSRFSSISAARSTRGAWASRRKRRAGMIENMWGGGNREPWRGLRGRVSRPRGASAVPGLPWAGFAGASAKLRRRRRGYAVSLFHSGKAAAHSSRGRLGANGRPCNPKRKTTPMMPPV